MLAYLLVTLGGAASVIVWIRWLWRRTSVPRWMLVALGVLAFLLFAHGMSATSLGIVRYWGTTIFMEPSAALRIAVLTSVARTAVPLVLIVLTWEYHWSRAKKTPPTP